MPDRLLHEPMVSLYFQRCLHTRSDPWKCLKSNPTPYTIHPSMFHSWALVLRVEAGSHRTSHPLNSISSEQIELRFIAPDMIRPLTTSPIYMCSRPCNSRCTILLADKQFLRWASSVQSIFCQTSSDSSFGWGWFI
uniref:Uncharacterized protein n=1 Tax=Caenorhabditis japonica TaxID=281687 RepID=A0A8R1IQT0_CAEJA